MLDEPLSGLDTLVRDEVVNGLLQQAADTTILISSHELAEIESFTTHVAFMQNGRLLLQEAIESLQSRFREVHVTFSAVKELPQPLPAGWLLPAIEGHRLRFIGPTTGTTHSSTSNCPVLRCREGGMRAHAAARRCQRADATAQAKSRTMNLRIVGAMRKKDVRGLLPLVLLAPSCTRAMSCSCAWTWRRCDMFRVPADVAGGHSPRLGGVPARPAREPGG